MEDRIVQYVEAEYEAAVERRHYIHRHPELSYQEYKTTEYIEGFMKEWGISYERLASGTGLVAFIEGEEPGKTIAFRCDIDALPMQEETNVPFQSEGKNIMHACGHDMHTANMLGFAHILSLHKELVKGKVKFLFQPAEELFPGGSRKLIAEGFLDDVDVIYGLHVTPFRTYQEVSIRKGAIMSGSYVYRIRVKGKGGHGSNPSNTVDPVVAASAVVMALQTIVSRNAHPSETLVVSTCMIHGGTKGNIIPDYVDLEGQIRSYSEELGRMALQRIREIVEGVCAGYGCKTEIEFEDGYAPLINEDTSAETAERALQKMHYATLNVMEPELGSEDFSYYLYKTKGAFFHLGVRSSQEAPVIPPHSTHFLADDRALATGMEAFLRILLEEE